MNDDKPNYPRYNYGHVDMDRVLENPSEFIIKECMPACEMLWSKNIETYMVGNYDNPHLFVLFGPLSEENMEIFERLAYQNPNYYYDGEYFGIRTRSMEEGCSLELLQLASVFQMQDTFDYVSSEQYIMYNSGAPTNYVLDDKGILIAQYSNDISDIKIEDVLRKANQEHLYVPEEDRVYGSKTALEWHKRYLEYISKSDNNAINSIL